MKPQGNDPSLPHPNGDPTIPGQHVDGRTPNERRYIDFPDNPDLYGQIEPGVEPHDMRRPQIYQDRRDPSPLRDFAPPGQAPPIGSPNSPFYGIDGQGGLRQPRQRSPLMVQNPRGDYDQMVAMGMIDPPPGFEDDHSLPGLPPPRGGPRGGFNPPGFPRGGPRGGGFDPPGFGGGFSFC
ncbi:hypothetical protein GPJ56_000033 [Histomonas meleagridis]|uniref:uncharacterized protein n=1 Tax=Histomonas meleagridis TaxID=135588 RepID=UPI0035594D6C|nr:hypothetical protein GPJ56_000033 [Histomonas meleagridis]KAH0805531.1 hypothetical protein GO595_001586 [Histomonas meleagridis]